MHLGMIFADELRSSLEFLYCVYALICFGSTPFVYNYVSTSHFYVIARILSCLRFDKDENCSATCNELSFCASHADGACVSLPRVAQ